MKLKGKTNPSRYGLTGKPFDRGIDPISPYVKPCHQSATNALPHALPCMYLPRTQVLFSSSSSSHTTAINLFLCSNDHGISSFIHSNNHLHPLRPKSDLPGPLSAQKGTDARRRREFFATYTHDRPFSKREIALTPHSPSGSRPTQKGNSRPLGTSILNKLRPLAPMPMSQCIATAA